MYGTGTGLVLNARLDADVVMVLYLGLSRVSIRGRLGAGYGLSGLCDA